MTILFAVYFDFWAGPALFKRVHHKAWVGSLPFLFSIIAVFYLYSPQAIVLMILLI